MWLSVSLFSSAQHGVVIWAVSAMLIGGVLLLGCTNMRIEATFEIFYVYIYCCQYINMNMKKFGLNLP